MVFSSLKDRGRFFVVFGIVSLLAGVLIILVSQNRRVVEADQALVEAQGTLDSTEALETYEALATLAVQERGQAMPAAGRLDQATRDQLGLLLAAREPQAALSHLLQAAELDPKLAEQLRVIEQTLQADEDSQDPAYLYLNVGRALASLDEWQLAEDALELAVQANPAYAEAWAYYGEALQHTGQGGQAALNNALALDPDSLAANLFYALFLRRQNDPAQALVVLYHAEVLDPQNPSIQAEIAAVLDELGQVNPALLRFQQAVLLDPKNPAFLHLLARYSIENDLQMVDVGMAAARQAVILDQEDAIALDLLGYAYYLLGDPNSALRFFQRALAADPNYAALRLHIGLLYLAQDDLSAARTQLELAVALAPGSWSAEQAARILENAFP